jgi:hypothetical protein
VCLAGNQTSPIPGLVGGAVALAGLVAPGLSFWARAYIVPLAVFVVPPLFVPAAWVFALLGAVLLAGTIGVAHFAAWMFATRVRAE